jgi:hypothetical protein
MKTTEQYNPPIREAQVCFTKDGTISQKKDAMEYSHIITEKLAMTTTPS